MMNVSCWFGALCLTCLASCGAIVNGSKQTVRISSVPPGALVSVNGRERRTPAVLRLDRHRDYVVKLRMNGFEPVEEYIESIPDQRPTILNCVFALCIPELWESDEPSHFRLVPESLDVTLTPEGWSPR